MKCTKWILPLIFLFIFACKPAEKNVNPLAEGFQNPPNQAKPYVWWHWVNGCVSKQGITNDLEAMAKQGIGGATIFSVQQDIERFRDYKPVYDFMTPEWRGMVRHAIQEADRLGMKILMHNCDGFGTSGGPWVKPEGAMKMVTFSRVNIMGPRSYKEQLPSPYTNNNFYREIAVVAFPVLSSRRGSMHDYAFEITSDVKVMNLSYMTDLNMHSSANFNPPPKNGPASFTISFKEAFPAAAFIIADNYNNQNELGGKYRLEYSLNGKTFISIRDFDSDLSTHTRFNFPEISAKHFRFTVLDYGQSRGANFTIPEIELLEKDGIPHMPKINDFEVKAGYWIRRRDQRPASPVPANWLIDREKMLILSEKLDDQGVLTWDVPEGEWEVMRIGYTLTGHMNGPATDAGRGLECDKLDAGFVEAFFNGMPKETIEENKDLVGKSFTHILSDSWEAKCQNWTEILPEEFKTRRGYEIIPFMPVLCGEIVGSVEISERFLYDFRKTIAELIKENYYSKLTQLYNAHGMKYQAEASGAQQHFFDPISYPSVIDQPMTEFWVNENSDFPQARINGDVMGAVAAAQLYDKSIISAEAFTSGAGNWKQTPFNLKKSGDMAFALGINQLYFHSSTHQPDETYPGWQMGKWGICMNRKITWWEQSHAWLSYLARCQFMLQQGHFVGDILAFHSEGAPVSTFYAYQSDEVRQKSTSGFTNLQTTRAIAPPGYAWTGCNDETILSRLTVKDNKLILPHGASYRVLILPERTEMTPGLLKALKKLIMEGAVVYGPKPLKSPSLVNYPAADEEVIALTSEIWGNIDGENIVEHPLGKGKMVWGIPLKELLEKLNIDPDFEFISDSRETDLIYNHRKTEDADFYFISNQTLRTESVECFFRVGNKQPEIWYPENGEMKQAGQYEVVDGRVKMPLQLDPYGSLFVVFRDKSGSSITKLSSGDNNSVNSGQVWKENNSYVFTTSQEGNYTLHSNKGKTSEISVKNLPAPLLITGNWEVMFPEGWGAPAQADFDKLISWHNHPDEGIKYFSGTASYLKEIDIPAEMLSENYRISIDLGAVKDLAEVIVNGKNTGVLWKLPFSADITAALVPGNNKLEIKVTNVWANRLIGDQINPQNRRYTEPMNTIHYDDPQEQTLRASGLLGPVKISVSYMNKL